jgi:hypothetical protein
MEGIENHSHVNEAQAAVPGLGTHGLEVPVAKSQAWEMIENGRYQPRRIKGSCLGRELG